MTSHFHINSLLKRSAFNLSTAFILPVFRWHLIKAIMSPLFLILLRLDFNFFCPNIIIHLSDDLHSYGTFTERNWLFCTKQSLILTWGLSETYLAQCRMRRMASILVSGKEALQANSDRHLTASWNESMVAAKCFSNTFARRWIEGG